MKASTNLMALGLAAALVGAAAWRAVPSPSGKTSPASGTSPLAPGLSALLPAKARAANRDQVDGRVDPGAPAGAGVPIKGEPAAWMVLAEALRVASTPEEKGAAADALGALGGYEAVAGLLGAAAAQASPEERGLILSGLNNLSDAEGFATLATTLAATRDPQLLEAAVAHLARTDAPEVLEVLVELYRERNDAPVQKNQALRAIAGLRHPGMARPLGKLARLAPEPALAEAAATASREIRRTAGTEDPIELLP